MKALVLRPDAGTFDEPVSARASLRRFGFLALLMVSLVLIATAN